MTPNISFDIGMEPLAWEGVSRTTPNFTRRGRVLFLQEVGPETRLGLHFVSTAENDEFNKVSKISGPCPRLDYRPWIRAHDPEESRVWINFRHCFRGHP